MSISLSILLLCLSIKDIRYIFMLHSDNVWPMKISLKKVEKLVGRWNSIEWQIDQVLPASVDGADNTHIALLQLYKDERASYRLNLDMDNPLLYLVCDETANGDWLPSAVSADQNVAAGCLEGDTPVLSFSMPEAIACWIEAFITRHGEVEISAHRRKHVNRRKEIAEEQRRKIL